VILEITNVSKHFGGVPAVDDCTFCVQVGEVLGLIGPNGAGKSTLIDLVSGFQQPSSGTVRFGGRDVTRQPAHVISELGMVRTFQLARVWGGLTVLENLLVAGCKPAEEKLWRTFFTPAWIRARESTDRARAREILASFDLLRLRDSPAQQLSGGQKRLLEFARILMRRPPMALLDEPSASLSPAMSQRIGEGIQQLAATGITVVLIEHDLPLVEAMCTRVVVMALGKVIADGGMHEHRVNELVLNAYLGAGSRKTSGDGRAPEGQ
jgi:ABC-type branched-subunit amino acid transport system ATPase component